MRAIFVTTTGAATVSFPVEEDSVVKSFTFGAAAAGQVLLTANPTLTTAALVQGWRDDVIGHAQIFGAAGVSASYSAENFPVSAGSTLFVTTSAAAHVMVYLDLPS
jgi:hypothetical protein